MAASKMGFAALVLLLIMVVIAEATPPGIANHPSKASCKIKKYKHCYNLEHVCPKFCPDSCTVECASCKPICGESTNPPPQEDDPSPPSQEEPSPPSKDEKPKENPNPPPPQPTPPYTPPSQPSPATPTPYTPPSQPSPTTPPMTPTPYTPPSQPHPSNATSPTPSWTPPSSSASKKAKCEDPRFTHCYNSEHVCPKSCNGGCEVDCNSCKPVCNCDKPGAVCQDPRFIGGDGLTFYFHGKKDHDFCLFSDPDLHINGHFIGRRNHNMDRDFTWVQSIGVLFDNHRVFMGAHKTSTWDASVDRLSLTFDGEPIFLQELQGARWQSPAVPSATITRLSDVNSVAFEVEGKFKISATVTPITEEDSRIHNYGITKDDCFAHLDLGFKFYSLSDEVHGVLGQTYGKNYVSKVKIDSVMPVMGGFKEFVSSSLFAIDCAVTQFNSGRIVNQGKAASGNEDYASLSCGSGLEGRGIVCKK